MCREFPRSQDPRATQIQFPLSSFTKTKEFQRKPGQDLTPSQHCCCCCYPHLALTHTPWQCARSYPVELMAYVCAWRVCYLAQIHNSQPCLSMLLLTIARQQSAATHIEYCATASRCLGQPGHPPPLFSLHPHSSKYI